MKRAYPLWNNCTVSWAAFFSPPFFVETLYPPSSVPFTLYTFSPSIPRRWDNPIANSMTPLIIPHQFHCLNQSSSHEFIFFPCCKLIHFIIYFCYIVKLFFKAPLRCLWLFLGLIVGSSTYGSNLLCVLD